MKSRKGNLELTLLPSTTAQYSHDHMMMEMRSPQEQQKQQPLTIFYNGTVCVCDVTELQARAIIGTARGGEAKTPIGWEVGSMVSPSPSPLPSMQSHNYSPTALSMKRSLRSFLQKRRNRIEATSPHPLIN